MSDLLLIFLGAAFLENLVLARFFDHAIDPSGSVPYGLFAIVGALLLLVFAWPALPLKLPAQAESYLGALAFVTCAVAVAQCGAGGALIRSRRSDSRVRKLLPLAVANAAVIAFAVFDQRRAHPLLETATFCFGASLAFQLIAMLFPSLRDRFEPPHVPAALRGLPITMITAALVSLAAMGFTRAWP